MPKVSICLPCLNTSAYLDERFETILAQTFTDWECFVYDSYSDDGSWEIICKYSLQDSRIRCQQGPREGIYPAWNHCIQQTKGDYIYIATSDDTMAHDCLEKLVEALEKNPTCGIAHCNLKAIGEGAEEYNTLWNDHSIFRRSSASLRDQNHIRKSPLNAILQLTQHTIFTSITQILIRKSLLDKVGVFYSTWGSAGDFHWQMRAGFMTDTVHVSGTWGGWRLHALQATNTSRVDTPEYRIMIQDMIKDAIRMSWEYIPNEIRRDLNHKWMNYFHDQWIFNYKMKQRLSKFQKFCVIGRSLLSGSRAARNYVKARIFRTDDAKIEPHITVVNWLEKKGLTNLLQKV